MRVSLTSAVAVSLLFCLLSIASSHSLLEITDPFVKPSDGKVLVLGSGGLIGRSVTKWLKSNGYEVLEVRNRHHIDLRNPHALDTFNQEKVSFAIFLACEVGGSKFLDSKDGNVQLTIVENNVLIYQSVLHWLARHKVPFVFSSSYLQIESTSYGTIKRLGERWIEGLGLGRIARLWNVYGFENISLKSHVLGDWVHGCLTKGSITCFTTGEEARQFTHADDIAAALGKMMLLYDRLDLVTDLSNNQWIPLRSLAELVSSLSPKPCSVQFTDKLAVARLKLEPNVNATFYSYWQPELPLSAGVKRLFLEYEESMKPPDAPVPTRPSASRASAAAAVDRERELGIPQASLVSGKQEL